MTNDPTPAIPHNSSCSTLNSATSRPDQIQQGDRDGVSRTSIIHAPSEAHVHLGALYCNVSSAESASPRNSGIGLVPDHTASLGIVAPLTFTTRYAGGPVQKKLYQAGSNNPQFDRAIGTSQWPVDSPGVTLQVDQANAPRTYGIIKQEST